MVHPNFTIPFFQASSTMRSSDRSERAQREANMQEAIAHAKLHEEESARAVAGRFKVSHSTLLRRLDGGISRAKAREPSQLLSSAEENTLVRWVMRFAAGGSPIPPELLRDLAQLIREQRVRHSSAHGAAVKTLDPIGHVWHLRFLQRHASISSLYARQLEHSRFNGATYEAVKCWFDAVVAQLKEHSYKPRNIYNMDESGFGVGESQTTRVLVPVDFSQKQKVVTGKQEWVTVIECISAAGKALKPMVIFKGKSFISAWLPPNPPSGWHYAASENGWTSNALGLNWLVKVFDPQTRDIAQGGRRMLIADGHGSHIQADFIAYCMDHNIDLLIMPPHCSHLLQPLDVGVFSGFKTAHSKQTDRVSRLSSQRISRPEWLTMFVQARDRAVTPTTIRSGWRGSGLWPSTEKNRQKVYARINKPSTTKPRPSTPPCRSGLDLSLLQSSPPHGTELRESNQTFNSVLAEVPGLPSPAKRYADRVTRLTETLSTEVTVLRSQLGERDELLQARKTHKTGKRVRLEGKFVYSTEEVLNVAREAEAARAAKRPRGRPRKRPIEEVDHEEEV
jgi:uncharacterized glyoxalase superfamily protein PhnB